jgi:colanic acid/amylovoran biosynthesis glycosyltransferase
MKIAYIIGEFPSLSETFILNQIIGLMALGHEIDIYAQKPKKSSKMHQDIIDFHLLSRTFYYPRIPRNYLIRLCKVLYFLVKNYFKERSFILAKSLNLIHLWNRTLSLNTFYYSIPFLKNEVIYDVVHCHFGHLGIIGTQLRHIGAFEGKICTTFHGWDMTEFLQISDATIYRQLFNKGDLFLPISKHWQKKLVELGCREQKIKVHHMGIDCKKFTYISRENTNKRPVTIITVARLVEKKGIEYALRAIAIAHQQTQSFQYQIIGDGPLRGELEALSTHLGIGHRVKFLGGQPQEYIIQMLNTSNFMLAPSVTSRSGDQEGIPVVLMEAMATGLPILSTMHSGIPELVEDGVSGFLVPERDVNALADKIIYLIENPQVWSRLGLAGRKEIEINYNIEILSRQLEEQFKNLC